MKRRTQLRIKNGPDAQARIASLTPREHEVLTHLITGRLNQLVARDVSTLEKVIEIHCNQALEKMDVHTIAGLIWLATKTDIQALRRYTGGKATRAPLADCSCKICARFLKDEL